jgi:hypothetical protein
MYAKVLRKVPPVAMRHSQPVAPPAPVDLEQIVADDAKKTVKEAEKVAKAAVKEAAKEAKAEKAKLAKAEKVAKAGAKQAKLEEAKLEKAAKAAAAKAAKEAKAVAAKAAKEVRAVAAKAAKKKPAKAAKTEKVKPAAKKAPTAKTAAWSEEMSHRDLYQAAKKLGLKVLIRDPKTWIIKQLKQHAK